jgi:hypothetical protein
MTAESDSASPFPTVRVAEVTAPAQSERWLVRSLWAASAVGIIGGAPKCSKTWLGLDLAVSVASGTPCLGGFAVERPGPVLVYLAEDSAAIARERIEGIARHRGLDLETLDLHLITAPAMRLDLASDILRLRATVTALKPRLLLLDPFVRLHRIDENNAGEVSGVLAELRLLQRTHDLAIVLVHHARKNGRGSAGIALRGSGDLYAWVDSYAYLQRRQSGLQLTLEHRFERAIEPVALTLVAEADGSCPHLELEDATAVDPTGAVDLGESLINAMRTAQAPLTRTALRAILRVNNQRLGNALGELVRTGRLVRTPQGWALPSTAGGAVSGVPVRSDSLGADGNGTANTQDSLFEDAR